MDTLRHWPYSFPPMAGASDDDPGAAGGAGDGANADSKAPSGASEDAKPGVEKSWIGRMFAPFRAVDDPASDVSQRAAATDDKGSAKPDDKSGDGKPAEGAAKVGADGKPAGEGADGAQPFKTFQTQQEYERDVQAESDRRESLRANRERLALKAKLRTEDPEAFARMDEEDDAAGEAVKATQALAGQVIDIYDGQIIAPLLERLPEDKRPDAIKLINSVEGRRQALELIVKHVEDDAFERGKKEGVKSARSGLASNPALRKELKSELRTEGGDPPELVEANGSKGSRGDMNAWLRRGL